MLNSKHRFDVPHQTHHHSTQTLSMLTGLNVFSSVVLTGGYRNHNVQLNTPEGPYVLRLTDGPTAEFKREIALLDLAHTHNVPVPTTITYGRDESTAHNWGLFHWLDGQTLEQALQDAPINQAMHRLFEQVGKTLSHIHNIAFDTAGFFDHELNIIDPLNQPGADFWHFMDFTLQQDRLKQRIAPSLRRQLFDFIEQYKYLFFEIQQPISLVHSDFNTKNIFVRQTPDKQWQLVAIMDWEFAYAGIGLADLGNFLRFEDDLPPSIADAFIKGYAHKLPDNWRCLARLIDMTSFISMLNRETLGPKTCATATLALQETMEQFQ